MRGSPDSEGLRRLASRNPAVRADADQRGLTDRSISSAEFSLDCTMWEWLSRIGRLRVSQWMQRRWVESGPHWLIRRDVGCCWRW
ncbi:hypothetical protein MLP_52520 [Microlunatus phosphovorus NM-1]|uniref:Uncharacterized protein n=1 Tax=Microlunatus phosphovorus (strain ATCC 700054 / DSM 10555 / JCM 9379 / NBRC 101784 / NCIMB 13414 / VKM Ac-1990 / NM-1) TaxID=1032480 RepID=F5XIM8_MICPN|nr:hypothetical protein MLP_52520 [Microlunatus phosphovorus NM-1]